MAVLYTGTVAHARVLPVRNSFRYGAYFMYASLSELDDLSRSHRYFSHNRPNIVTLHDRDHGPRDGSPLRPWIDAILTRAEIDLEGGDVTLLAFPRVLGFRFFPVAFWYCFHADGSLRAVLAEVNNTFGHHHNYLLHAGGAVLAWDAAPEATKAFSVSPFVELDATYRFHFTPPGDTVSVRIEDFVKGPLLLTASMQLHAGEFTDRTLLRTVLRYGPMSLRATLLIHWQALLIYSKHIPFVPPVPPPAEETSL